MTYFDGYLVPVPSANRVAYLAAARKFDAMLIAAGARRVVECWPDDVAHGKVTDFYRAVAAGPDEAVLFNFVEWPDKAARDGGMARVEAELAAGPDEEGPTVFDGARIVFGGFMPVIDLSAAEA